MSHRLGPYPSTSPTSPLLNALNGNINMLNNSSGMVPLIPPSSQRMFECGAPAPYMDPHSNNRDVAEHEHGFAGFRSEQSGRKCRQGSDGDSLPESPLSSGHEGWC